MLQCYIYLKFTNPTSLIERFQIDASVAHQNEQCNENHNSNPCIDEHDLLILVPLPVQAR